jgi:cell fate regulator YaaT (PSP1 superfamily)
MKDKDLKNQPSYLPRSYGGGAAKPKGPPERNESEPGEEREPAPASETKLEEEPVREELQSDDVADNEEMVPCVLIQDAPDETPTEPTEPPPCEKKRTAAVFNVRVVGVRFEYAGKIYNFDAGDMKLEAGDRVVVKTEKGLGLAKVAVPPQERELDELQLEGLRKILRKAGKTDFDQDERCREKEEEASEYCLELINKLDLPMKLVGVECFFDATKYVFYFTADGRVDFRELVKQLVARFPVRIEMRQIGVRHEAKMIGGLACCGQELCCSRFLTEFRPVSVKMAKRQNLSLNPSKISGGCGRLMCCLGYEHDIYEDFKEGLPKLGKIVNTCKGEGIMIKHNPLCETVTLQNAEGEIFDVRKEDILGESSQSAKRGKLDKPDKQNKSDKNHKKGKK